MAALQNPNHPLLVNGLFQPLAHSSSMAPQNNMCGILETPSYFQCSGLAVTKEKDFEVQLSTNTALNNRLEDGSTYSLNGQMIAMADETTPVLTYIDTSVVRVLDSSLAPPDMVNKTNVTGLGHVSHRAKFISTEPERSLRLEVTVTHNNWDPINQIHRRFSAKYVVPGTKNLVKTHTLFQVGREVQVVGLLVDFDPDTNMPIVLVSSVSVTCRHKTARSMLAGGVKFSNKAEANKPKGPTLPKASKTAESNLASASRISKGKAKLVEPESDDDDSSSDNKDNKPEGAAVPVAPLPVKQGRPRKDDLVAAAKKMKQM
ncbi:hypothetical protein PCASD_08487 [Puccinia coronata f. sp. avenae]|uniref:Uncharacterized protein n=1 Tax=Puccinia coronata f. sp. avenae TaxID=200324 RepID=A0A2N5UYE9_9BASI|nr:hypothetical protein PCASD_08487 [Puccinia coronata f. sp. avenae]